MAKDLRLTATLSSILMLITGGVLFFKPGISIKMICFAIAAVFFILAVTRLLSYLRLKKDSGGKATLNLIAAVLMVVIAVIFLIRPVTIAQIIPIVLGILIIIDGACLVFTGIVWNKFLPKRGVISLLVGIISIILGYFAITHAFATELIFMKFIGIALMVAAISNIANQFMIEGADRRKSTIRDVRFETTPASTDADTKTPPPDAESE